jgi:ssDNA-binding replication factor A large subunit
MESEDWLFESLTEKTGMPKERILLLIKNKLSEFPNLTESAALRMVATENGVVPIRNAYKIADIGSELNHININATIKRKFPSRQITVRGAKSKIMNLVLEDQSGAIATVIWDSKKIDAIESSAMPGDEISIANAYSKKNKISGGYEINIGSNSAIKIKKKMNQRTTTDVNLQKLSEIKDDTKLYHIRCFLVRLFTNNIYLVRCNICKKKVTDKCEEHGDKALSKTFMVSGILDDGLSSIRATFFDKTAEKLLKFSPEEGIENKLRDLSFGLYELDVTGVPNKFNDLLSLTVKDVKISEFKSLTLA